MSGWLRRLSIRQKLLGAFGVDLVLMMLLGGFALYQMGVVRQQADEVAIRTLPSIQNVDRIQDLVVRYRRLQLEFALYANAGDRSRTEGELKRTEAEMRTSLAHQPELLNRPEEQEAFRAFTSLWDQYVEATHRKFLPAIRRGNTGTVQPALSRLNPLHRRLMQATDQLKQLGSLAAEDAMSVLQETHRTSRRFILADTALSVAISAFVGLVLAATLSERIRRLTSATRRVASGDLDPPLEDDPRVKDELGLLTENFEAMVASLRRQREALEQRHRDLVRRKEAEEAAYRARAEAEARDAAKSLFLATMSHELRTPLNAVLGYVQLMTLEAEARGNEQPLEDLRRIGAAGKHLATLINNLLDFSKIEQGEMDLEIREFRLEDLVREVEGIVAPLVTEPGNRLELKLAPELGTMTSDPGKLRQILFNLLSNAGKFTRNGVITVTVEPLPETGEVRIAVADTGIGIEPEHLEVIFEPFRQADASIAGRFGGTGLGLVVSRRLSVLLGGSLTVTSVPGEGSVFTVRLPVQLSEEAVTAGSESFSSQNDSSLLLDPRWAP